MVAQLSDKFLRTGKRGTKTTLSSPGKAVGVTSLTIDNPTNWETGTAIIFSLYRTNPDGTEEEGSYTTWKGLLVGSQITGLQLKSGDDQPYGAGGNTVAIMHISNAWVDELLDGLAVSHEQNGELKLTPTFRQIMMDAIIPVAKMDVYYGTKAAFLADPANVGWLFMEKATDYSKTTYNRLYTHLKAVDAASVINDTGTTFQFAAKLFGRVMVSLDPNDTDFDTLGKSGGAKTHTIVPANLPPEYLRYAVGGNGNWTAGGNNLVGGAGTSAPISNLQPFTTVNCIIKI